MLLFACWHVTEGMREREAMLYSWTIALKYKTQQVQPACRQTPSQPLMFVCSLVRGEDTARDLCKVSCCQEETTVPPQWVSTGDLFNICFSSLTVSKSVHVEGPATCPASQSALQEGHHSNILSTRTLMWIKSCYERRSKLHNYICAGSDLFIQRQLQKLKRCLWLQFLFFFFSSLLKAFSLSPFLLFSLKLWHEIRGA